jgi:adenine-specific DNA-methyltransferase
MKLINIKPKQALNKAFLKVKPVRKEIETFKTNLTELLDRTNDTESEEFHKNLVSDFLKKTYYEPNFYINTKGRQDLVIHNGNKAKDPVGVILETKKPTNKNEMVSENRLNVKAFQELVLYYLRERITEKNLEVKYLIITNIHEWYIFNAADFEKHFAQNKAFVKQFQDFENGSLSGTKTDFFYKEIAFPAIENITEDIECTHFDIRDYEKALRNDDLKDDVKLIALFKLLSPQHVLKRPFTNDSNSLDKRFYAELLHIIGLTEEKDGGKKIIQRQKTGQRNHGALLEDAIVQLDSLDKISRLEKPSQFGANNEERLFNVGLELSITWMNRILFLKLLEAQLQTYHNGDKKYAFLNSDRIRNYDDLNTLFFQVLARKYDERNEFVQKEFADVPYLNSSLFEPTDLEHYCFSIVQLNNSAEMPLYSSTVLKDSQGKRRSGKMNTLDYLFAFLNAYDFSGEGSEDIQEDNKTLINASVLGLIFEKINGYKDGSFFTPGFITMYMCRETIRKAVIQKFNEALVSQKNATDSASPNELEQTYETITDVYNAIGSRGQFTHQEANGLINDVKICDPAVGSGHFLVSALNEMIAVKHELGVLHDRQGKLLRDYDIHVENDELIVTDYNGELFEYQLSNRESQRVQETLFHEKQTIIENCLFGVDINPNSVKICRLRLWIELLKNAYYKNETELETLPNIDINIKCGNSLISRFGLDADLKKALKQSKWNIDSYRIAVQTYRNAQSKDEKREMERLIADIKSNFRSEISLSDPKLVRLYKLKGELMAQTTQTGLFERSRKETIAFNKATKKLSDEINKLETEVEEIKSNKIYENAFEWRFEFPEVLDDEGDFVGFDVVIGNPPYGLKFENNEKEFFKNTFQDVHVRTPESYNYFVKQFTIISSKKALCCLIIPSSFLNQTEFEKTRQIILSNHSPFIILNLGDAVFEDVATPTCIIGFDMLNTYKTIKYEDLTAVDRKLLANEIQLTKNTIQVDKLTSNQTFSFIYRPYTSILNKCYNGTLTLKDIAEDVATGISPGLGEAFVVKIEEANKKGLENKIIKKLIVGGEINRYELQPKSGKGIIYFTNKMTISDFPETEKHLSSYKVKLENRVETKSGAIPWYVMLRPRRQKLFDEPKILIRQTANRIMAAYDDEKWYCLKSGIIIQLPSEIKLSYKYLLGLLNSSLMDFLYNDLVNENNRIFPEVKPIQLLKLPIQIASKEIQKSISLTVDKITSTKKEGKECLELEKELNKFIYQVYGLTEEEIQIVENS